METDGNRHRQTKQTGDLRLTEIDKNREKRTETDRDRLQFSASPL